MFNVKALADNFDFVMKWPGNVYDIWVFANASLKVVFLNTEWPYFSMQGSYC